MNQHFGESWHDICLLIMRKRTDRPESGMSNKYSSRNYINCSKKGAQIKSMNKKLRMLPNNFEKSKDPESTLKLMSVEEVEKARKFHESFPEYKVTPLRSLSNLAKKLGISGIYLKDESYRFGLNAFKVLGGSYAIGNYLAKKLGEDISDFPYEKLVSEEVRNKVGDVTFYTATDGNHGRGVAWTANRLKQKSVVYMPLGSSEFRLEKIRGEGADASITDLNYDDAVRLADKHANETNGVMVQDTAWEGYTDIPNWIMQGYGTMALEADDQLKEFTDEVPTHIFIQAGVGSLAGAIQGYFAVKYGDKCPITVIVEPDEANCYYQSAAQKKLVNVSGDMRTIMAGLACGEPNVVSFEIIKNYSEGFLSLPDYVAADGMRVLGNPLTGDEKVISGESGAAPMGALFNILAREGYEEVRKKLRLDENSRVLLFSTEGDTDPDKYREIVWEGFDSLFC